MKDIYYIHDGQKHGPVQMDELKKHPIGHDTYLWTSGQPEWMKANSLTWMEEYLKSVPPPIPKEITSEKILEQKQVSHSAAPPRQSQKYDPNYRTDDGALLFGVALVVISVLFWIMNFPNDGSANEGENRGLLAMVSLLVRVIAAIWVNRLANEQNRKPTLWTIFAILFPGPTLIAAGNSKRLLK